MRRTALTVLLFSLTGWAGFAAASVTQVRASVQSLFPDACGNPNESLRCSLTLDGRGACAHTALVTGAAPLGRDSKPLTNASGSLEYAAWVCADREGRVVEIRHLEKSGPSPWRKE